MERPYHSRKYTLNEKFFSRWSTNMSYVLGLWFADGNMRKEKSYIVRIWSKDIDHLKLVNKALDSNSPIEIDKRFYCGNLNFRSKKLFTDLSKLGGLPAKSTKLQFPKIPNKYLRDFIRGYFDGDGSVHFIHYKATKNGKIYWNIRSNFTCGSKNFLEDLKNFLLIRLSLYNKKVCQYGPHQFKLGYGQNDTYKLLKYMYYPNHKLSLERKRKYLGFFRKYNCHKKSSFYIT